MPNIDERTLEETYRSAVNGLYARLKSNYDFICRKFGNDGLNLIVSIPKGDLYCEHIIELRSSAGNYNGGK